MNAITTTLDLTYTTYDAEDMRHEDTVYVGPAWAGRELPEGCVRRVHFVPDGFEWVDSGAWFWAGDDEPTFIHFYALAKAATIYRLRKVAAEAVRQAVTAIS